MRIRMETDVCGAVMLLKRVGFFIKEIDGGRRTGHRRLGCVDWDGGFH